jgi:GNAT superfamily N-acetyltransferase
VTAVPSSDPHAHAALPLRVRAATADDQALCCAITEDAMRGYVEQTWGRWDPEEQRRKHADDFTPATHRIVLVDEEAAGLVALEDLPDHLWLVKLYLRAPYRGRGIGSQLLRDVLGAARALGKPVRLRVLRVNTGARRLYERHGFRVVDESVERFFMQSGDGSGNGAALRESGIACPRERA